MQLNRQTGDEEDNDDTGDEEDNNAENDDDLKAENKARYDDE